MKVHEKNVYFEQFKADTQNVGIDEKILNQVEKLNSSQWQQMRTHTEIGYRILSSSSEFSKLAVFVLNHHERWDGKGYPKGLKGSGIPIEFRIISVADAFYEMTSERMYKKAMDNKVAINELFRCSDSQFDSEIMDVFVNKVLLVKGLS